MRDGHAAPAAQESRSRRAPQNRQVRDDQRAEYDDHLAAISQIEAGAGPTLRIELSRSKRVQAAYQISQDRADFVKRRLGQRSGLLRLLRVELGADPVFDDRSMAYVRHMLMVSANVAAVTGSGWKSTLSWFRSRLSAFTDQMSSVMNIDFDRYVEEARIELARRTAAGDPNLIVGASPAEIAADLVTNTVQLRQARANTCGLTSIDPPDPKVRDRERKAAARDKAGKKTQAERRATGATATMKALAELLGCSLRKVYRMRGDQPLAAFVAAHGHAGKDVSGVDKRFDGGNIFVTPANDDQSEAAPPLIKIVHGEIVPANDDTPAPAAPLTETGYTGRHMSMTAWEVKGTVQRHPVLQDDLQRHLDAVDELMVKTPPENHKRVRRNLLQDRNRLVHRDRRAQAQAA